MRDILGLDVRITKLHNMIMSISNKKSASTYNNAVMIKIFKMIEKSILNLRNLNEKRSIYLTSHAWGLSNE